MTPEETTVIMLDGGHIAETRNPAPFRSTRKPNGRRMPGASFWLDWAPMILLGITIALAGAFRISTVVPSGQPDPSAIVSGSEARPAPAPIDRQFREAGLAETRQLPS